MEKVLVFVALVLWADFCAWTAIREFRKGNDWLAATFAMAATFTICMVATTP